MRAAGAAKPLPIIANLIYHMHSKNLCSHLTALLLTAAPAFAALNVVEDFSTNPLTTGRWTFGAGSNAGSRFVYQPSAAAYPGDAGGSLAVHFDSSLPTARLDFGLGATLTDTDNFTIVAQFSLAVTTASPDQTMQISFGLVNHTLTGGNRTGTPLDYSSDNTFHTVEFNYFPNVSALYGGPTLAPTVFGAQKPGADAFGNTATIFGPGSDLGDNLTGITALPQNVNLQATLTYTGSTKQLALQIAEINPLTGALTSLVTGVPVLNLLDPPAFGAGYDPLASFSVNSLAIMAYQDGFTTPGDPSLVADVTFQRMALTASVPEPTITTLLLGVALFGAARMRRRADSPRST